jgi:hypothetical protein
MTKKQKSAAVVDAFRTIEQEAHDTGRRTEAAGILSVLEQVEGMSDAQRTRLFDLVTQAWCEA